MSSAERLVFVYSADSGVANALRDVWHRATSPATYPCQLCKVTYGVTGMRRDWQEFTRSLDLPVVFLHRDELRDEYGDSIRPGLELPVALVDGGGHLTEIVGAEQMRRMTTVPDLQRLVSDGLAAHQADPG